MNLTIHFRLTVQTFRTRRLLLETTDKQDPVSGSCEEEMLPLPFQTGPFHYSRSSLFAACGQRYSHFSFVLITMPRWSSFISSSICTIPLSSLSTQLGCLYYRLNQLDKMCRTIRLTTICPRCMNPYMTRTRKFGEVESLTISEPETIICSYAFETRQVCASAMTDTYDDGTKYLIPEFDRLGEDFCDSCVSRLKLRVVSLPAPLQRRVSLSRTYSEGSPRVQAAVATETPQEAPSSIAPSMIIYRPINHECPGFGTNPRFWIDLLDGNHIMVMPNRKRRRNAKGGKGKASTKTKKDMKVARTAIRKKIRKSFKKASPKTRLARLTATDDASIRDACSVITTSEQCILSPVGKSLSNSIGKKSRNRVGSRASIPRKAKQTK